jgi:dTDP-4-amino-4,6-dideoxygalactose transaminase
MVAPVRWSGAEPRFFRLLPDLTPDLAHLRQQLGSDVRALVVVHYFGFVVDVSPLRKLCDERDIRLIEDCAHAFFGHRDLPLPGSSGDFALASTRKFFPGADGGMLIANGPALAPETLSGPGFGKQIKGFMACVQQASNANKLGVLSRPLSGGLAGLDRLRGRSRQSPSSPPAATIQAGGADDWFDPAEMHQRGRAVSRWLIGRSNLSRVTARRRANFAALLDRLAALPGARPVYERLPDTVVPYVFPWLLDDPQTTFPRLKTAGVPMYRWEALADSDCAVSADYRYRLVQLPCHQEIDAAELDWLVDQCRRALEDSR